MYTIMENLINHTFYTNKEGALQKVNVFYAYEALSEDEFKKLMDLINEKYPETTNESSTTTTV